MLSTNLQNPIDFKGQKFYVGLDVHKKSWAVSLIQARVCRRGQSAKATRARRQVVNCASPTDR